MLKVEMLTYVDKEGDTEPISLGRTRAAAILDETGTRFCRIENGVGHCCGASFLCMFAPVVMSTRLDELIAYLKENVMKKLHPDMYWTLQDKVFLYLSDETVFWDAPLRNHPRMSLVYSFNNKATKPYSGSKVDLFVLDLS
jgi:hypothetical protein